jgi:hypothetical protein
LVDTAVLCRTVFQWAAASAMPPPVLEKEEATTVLVEELLIVSVIAAVPRQRDVVDEGIVVGAGLDGDAGALHAEGDAAPHGVGGGAGQIEGYGDDVPGAEGAAVDGVEVGTEQGHALAAQRAVGGQDYVEGVVGGPVQVDGAHVRAV